MVLNKLCKDNSICCDDNCKRCANLIYAKYMEQKAEIEKLQAKVKSCLKEMERIALMTVETDIKEREK